MDADSPITRGTITPVQFEGLLQRLDLDRDRAGEKYDHIRRKLIKFFEWNSCSAAEDLADQTLDRVARKIQESEIQDVVAFAWGVAKNVRQEAHKKGNRIIQIQAMLVQESCGQSLGTEQAINEHIHAGRQLRGLRRCIARLSLHDRELFLAYYSGSEGYVDERQRLARSLGITMGALRVRVKRLREKLEECVRAGGQC